MDKSPEASIEATGSLGVGWVAISKLFEQPVKVIR